jgi:hypothetical protein
LPYFRPEIGIYLFDTTQVGWVDLQMFSTRQLSIVEMASSTRPARLVELDGWLGDSWSSCGDNADSTLDCMLRSL